MKVEALQPSWESPRNRLKLSVIGETEPLHIRAICTHLNTHIQHWTLGKGNEKIVRRYENVKHVQFDSRRVHWLAVRLCIFFFSSLLSTLLFLAFPSYISTAPQYYVVLCTLFVHKNFFLSLYVFNLCSVFNWTTRGWIAVECIEEREKGKHAQFLWFINSAA